MPITAVATMFIRSQGIGIPAALWGFVGLRGIAYAAIVTRRMRAQDAYQPEFEDWLFHVLLPFAAYVTLAVSAYGARSHLREALFGVAAAVLLLLFTTPGMPSRTTCLSRPGPTSGNAESGIDIFTPPLAK
jgi:hypothetical protein